MTTKSLIILNTLCVLSAFSVYNSNNNICVSEYKIKSSKVPNNFSGFKILQLSDLHNKSFGNKNKNLIKKINKISPDIIVITGDMIVRQKDDYSVFLDLTSELSKLYKIYYISGNHEQKASLRNKKIDELFNSIKNMGVTVLDNNMVQLVRGSSYINLYGIMIDLKYYKYDNSLKDVYFKQKQVENIIGVADEKDFNILLAHNPFYFEAYALWGADITLSGHVHGGMIRLPFVGALLSPERKFFPKYSEGKYLIEDKILIVSRGLGSGKLAFRLFNRPELSIITLINE